MSDAGACQVDVHVVRAPDRLVPAHRALLSAPEQSVCDRFRMAARQARYACAHALLRCRLGAILDQPPAAIAIEAGRHQRPQLPQGPQGTARVVDFNLSTTRGYVACVVLWRPGGSAISPAGDVPEVPVDIRVGIDMEAPREGTDTAAMRDMVLSGAEKSWLDGAGRTCPDAFFRLWTLKEAIVKADGRGLGVALNRLTAVPDETGGLTLALDSVQTPSTDWRVLLLNAGVPAALALRSGVPGVLSRLRLRLNPSTPGGFEAVPVQVLSRHPV